MQSAPRVEGSGIFHIKRNLFHLRFHILSQLTISSAALFLHHMQTTSNQVVSSPPLLLEAKQFCTNKIQL
jgi:hypothetical protein